MLIKVLETLLLALLFMVIMSLDLVKDPHGGIHQVKLALTPCPRSPLVYDCERTITP